MTIDWFRILEVIVGLLVAGNLYFIQRLVAKIDQTALAIHEIQSKLPLWEQKLDQVEDKITTLFRHVEDISHLKRDVAVLQTITEQLKLISERKP
jgi:hypothetical protein